MNPLKICHVIANIRQHAGGTSYSVTSIANQLASLNHKLSLMTLDYPGLGQELPLTSVDVHRYAVHPITKILRGYNPKLSKGLQKTAQTNIDIIHNHGLWMFPNLYARQAAVSSNTPLVTSPRGMLEPWSLQNSRLKKLLAWNLFERKNLQAVHMFHATSMMEYESIRRQGFTQPVCIIPNGIEIPSTNTIFSRSILEERFPLLKDRKWLLFMSRLHKKKGLELLLNVWNEIAASKPDWILIIAGPDLNDYRLKLERIVDKLNLNNSVVFTGMLEADDKYTALANSDIFVLPSYSENFGNVVAEALAYGTPVVTTKNTPWKILAEKNYGWWIDLSYKNLKSTLQSALNSPQSDLNQMGQRGKKYVTEQLDWKKIANDLAQAYYWLLKGGSKPEFIA